MASVKIVTCEHSRASKYLGRIAGSCGHTLDNATAIASVALGASIIDKHVTLDRSGTGSDDSFSLEPPDLDALCRNAKMAWAALGLVDYGQRSSRKSNKKCRRSLYFVRALKAGEVIGEECVRSVRPGYGLPPKMMAVIIGRTLATDVEKDSPVTPEAIRI